MTVLITGAGGFIGSSLMDALTGRWENEVYGFDNFLTGRRENHPEVMELDILNREGLYMLANEIEPDVVIHCAASYSDPDLWHRDTETNVAGCINAAAVAKHHSAHLIYFQTILPPVSSYAISKIAGEQYLRLSGVPLTVLRLANIYGPRNLSGPIPTFYKRLTEGKPIVVVDTTRDMVMIHDLVEAVKRVVERGLVGTFDVCSGKQTEIYDLFELVRDSFTEHSYTGVAPMIPPAPDDVQGTVSPDNGIPSWMPIIPLAQGIKETVASYREIGVDHTHTHLRIGEKDAS